MLLRDWFDWTNSGVGAAGFLVTVGAIWQATGAKRAASEARQAIYRRNSAEDLGRVLDLALDFSSALQTARDELALHLAGRFISTCTAARERYRGFLGTEGGKLETAVDVIANAAERIQSGVDRPALLADAQRTVRLVSTVTGALDRHVEGERE
jgi:hypothetical protein